MRYPMIAVIPNLLPPTNAKWLKLDYRHIQSIVLVSLFFLMILIVLQAINYIIFHPLQGRTFQGTTLRKSHKKVTKVCDTSRQNSERNKNSLKDHRPQNTEPSPPRNKDKKRTAMRLQATAEAVTYEMGMGAKGVYALPSKIRTIKSSEAKGSISYSTISSSTYLNSSVRVFSCL